MMATIAMMAMRGGGCPNRSWPCDEARALLWLCDEARADRDGASLRKPSNSTSMLPSCDVKQISTPVTVAPFPNITPS